MLQTFTSQHIKSDCQTRFPTAPIKSEQKGETAKRKWEKKNFEYICLQYVPFFDVNILSRVV